MTLIRGGVYHGRNFCYYRCMEVQSAIRRKILDALYSCHKGEAYCPMKTRELMKLIGLVDEIAFFEGIQYLHDSGYLQGTHLPYEQPGYFETARITSEGVDLYENAPEMLRLFPTDAASLKLEGFIEKLTAGIQAAETSNEEKEDILQSIGRLIENPHARIALRRAFEDD